MDENKFKIGDIVYVTDKFPSYMSHFTGGANAMVIEGHARSANNKEYGVMFLKTQERHYWYEENQLTLLKAVDYSEWL